MAAGCHAQAGQAAGIVAGDGRGRRYRPIAGRQEGPNRPPETAASGPNGARRQHDGAAGAGGPAGQFRPQVQLGEHEGRGFQGAEERVDVGPEVVGEIAGDVNREGGGEVLRRGTEERVGELPIRLSAAHLLEDGGRLESLAHETGRETKSVGGPVTPGLCPLATWLTVVSLPR